MRSIFKNCALVLAVSLCGCAANPTKDNVHGQVTLEVKAGSLSGYDHTFGSDGNVYSYLYTGGDDGHGNVAVALREHAVTVPVHLNADQTFALADIYFRDDPTHQLGHPPITNPKEAVIQDRNDANLAAYYKVIVEYTLAPDNVVIVGCDPKIVNN